MISKDSIWINVKGIAKKRTQGQIENNFVLKGIVTNEAFTKIGRDFHDYFYQAYLLSSKKYPFIYLEDGVHEDDWANWQLLTQEFKQLSNEYIEKDRGHEFMIVGDDLFVTNIEKINEGSYRH